MDDETSSDARPISTDDASVAQWMTALGRASGNPGGGAASGLMLSIAAGLTAMVAGYTHVEEDADALARLRERAAERSRLALRLADDDAEASKAFGSAFRRPPGDERDEAVRRASIDAANASARLGERAVEAIDDLEWLAYHGNPALVADVAVAIGALRAAITGARTNVSFDLGSVRGAHETLAEVREEQPELWRLVPAFDDAIGRIDGIAARIDDRAAPTSH